jgi:hypothetical protein
MMLDGDLSTVKVRLQLGCLAREGACDVRELCF